MEKKTHTKGNVIIEDIKIGDIHYEFDYGTCIKTRVKTLPVAEKRENDTYWTWESVHIKPDGTDGDVIDYGVSDKYAHYGPNIYTNEAYVGCKYI